MIPSKPFLDDIIPTMQNILERVKSLNLPDGQYVVAGSAIMAMHGLKETKDIDIVVSQEIFDIYSKDDTWEKVPYTYEDRLGKIWLKKDEFELYIHVNYGEQFRPTLGDLLSKAEYFDGIPFICLGDLLKFKKAYNWPGPQI